MKAADNDEIWKQKYYKNLEELETREQQWRELETLLRNAAVRMSLAVDGLDPVVDQDLSDFRKVFRGTPTKAQIQRSVQSITDALDRLAVAKQRVTPHAETWKALLAMLKAVIVPKKLAAQKAAIVSVLLKCDQHTNLDPILNEIRQLLQAITSYYEQALKEQPRPGLFSRLFGRNQKPQQAEQARTLESNVVDLPMIVPKTHNEEVRKNPDVIRSGVDVLELLSRRLSLGDNSAGVINPIISKLSGLNDGQQLLQLAEDLSNALNGLWASVSSGGSTSSAESVREVLVALVDRIDFPPDLQADVQELQALLEDNNNTPTEKTTWTQVLDRFASLVAKMRERIAREKQELETFLTQLSTRLQNIDDSLQGVHNQNQEVHDNQVKMHSSVKIEVADLRARLAQASDVKHITQSVEQRLDAIIIHVDAFRDFETQRFEQATQTIQELNTRVHLLEKETSELHGKVKNQRRLALLDRLTNVGNRIAYDERMDQEYRRWRRFHDNLCLVLIDIDRFKSVNDRYGHKAGDKVLATVARIISEQVRNTDYFARYGGEEFVLIMTGANAENALQVADKLRAVVETCGFHFRGERVPVTISAGVAQFHDNDTPDDVFERADKAMYSAKNTGRNRCCGA